MEQPIEVIVDMQPVLEELIKLNNNVAEMNYRLVEMKGIAELVLIEVEIIAMSIIAIWLLQWIRRVCRKRRVSDNG